MCAALVGLAAHTVLAPGRAVQVQQLDLRRRRRAVMAVVAAVVAAMVMNQIPWDMSRTEEEKERRGEERQARRGVERRGETENRPPCARARWGREGWGMGGRHDP